MIYQVHAIRIVLDISIHRLDRFTEDMARSISIISSHIGQGEIDWIESQLVANREGGRSALLTFDYPICIPTMSWYQMDRTNIEMFKGLSFHLDTCLPIIYHLIWAINTAGNLHATLKGDCDREEGWYRRRGGDIWKGSALRNRGICAVCWVIMRRIVCKLDLPSSSSSLWVDGAVLDIC